MKEFVVISWNTQQMGFSKAFECADELAGALATVLKKRAGKSLPFVVFLLEIKGDGKDASLISKILNTAIAKETGRKLTWEQFDCGGEPTTHEHIIMCYSGMTLSKVTELDLQSKMETVIKKDTEQSKIMVSDEVDRIGDIYKFRPSTIGTIKNTHFRNTEERNSSWYRNGVICDFHPLQANTPVIKIASIHCPGPKFSDKTKFKSLSNDQKADWASIPMAALEVAKANKVDLLIGDMNYRGALHGHNFLDFSTELKTGTTLKKSDSKSFSSKIWDKLLLNRKSGLKVTLFNPIHPGYRQQDIGDTAPKVPLSDHGIIVGLVSHQASKSSIAVTATTLPDIGPRQPPIDQLQALAGNAYTPKKVKH